ncbi:MAG TPA: sugar phosphate isomerase/epimerase [Sedimentisphaerales bacterium]|nr:sugar phosphate isomerase/epimerase [Sedimentisphaerales bacterium]
MRGCVDQLFNCRIFYFSKIDKPPEGLILDSTMKKQLITKREFLKLGVTGALAACTGCKPLAVFSKKKSKKRIPIGVQLYSVRKECEKDLTGTIKAVAKMGYKGVEFAGYYGRDAKTLRKLLDSVGLVCCGTHTGIDTLLGDELPKTIEFNQTLGNKFLIVPGLQGNYRSSRRAWQETAKLFNKLSDKVKAHGMQVGYHNHSIEFKPLDGELPWDTFFGGTKKEVVMQLDTGNAMGGGGDPVMLLKRYPGRATTVHLKAFSKSKPNAIIGDDELPWQKIFELCETIGGTRWYIVEYESDAYPPLVSIEKCLETLRRLGKA